MLASNASLADVIYSFYGFDNCIDGPCTLVATGRFSVIDQRGNWYFKNLLTGAAYNTNDPLVDAWIGTSGVFPAVAGVADIWLDFVGENTYFTTGRGIDIGGPGSPTAWEHAFIEARYYHDDEGNETPLQQMLDLIPISGSHHIWVREVPEPGALCLLALGLSGIVLRRRQFLSNAVLLVTDRLETP
jgi:hypothetical protein